MADLDYNLLGANNPGSREERKLCLPRCFSIGSLSATERSLWIVGGINMVYVILQLIVAAQTGSLAMLSDAFHNLSDVGAAYVAFKCEYLRKKDSGLMYPFGYLRMQVLGALINSVCLVSLAFYLIISALPLLLHPHDDGGFKPSVAFICVAAIGVVINLISSALLCCGGKDAKGNPNFVHAHVGCSCDAHGGSVEGGSGASSEVAQQSEPCLDACCAPPVMDEEAIQVPFGFVKKKPRSSAVTLLPQGPAPIIVSDVEAPAPPGEEGQSKSKGSAFGLRNMDENVMAVMIHSAGDACSSLVVFAIGSAVYCMKHQEGGSGKHDGDWSDYLDPLVTIVLSFVMAYAVKGILLKSCKLLLEGSALSLEDLTALKHDLSQDTVLYDHGLVPKELILTDLDFDGKSRRASVVLAQREDYIRKNNLPFDQARIRKRVKFLLQKKGVKYGVVELRCPGDRGLLGMEEKDLPS